MILKFASSITSRVVMQDAIQVRLLSYQGFGKIISSDNAADLPGIEKVR